MLDPQSLLVLATGFLLVFNGFLAPPDGDGAKERLSSPGPASSEPVSVSGAPGQAKDAVKAG